MGFFQKRWFQPKSAPNKAGFFVRFIFDWLVPYSSGFIAIYLLATGFFSTSPEDAAKQEDLLTSLSVVVNNKIENIKNPYFVYSLFIILGLAFVFILIQSVGIIFKKKWPFISVDTDKAPLLKTAYWIFYLLTKISGYFVSLLALIIALSHAGHLIAVNNYKNLEQKIALSKLAELNSYVFPYLVMTIVAVCGLYFLMYRNTAPRQFLVITIKGESDKRFQWDKIFNDLRDQADILAKSVTGFWTQNQMIDHTGTHGVVVMSFGKTIVDKEAEIRKIFTKNQETWLKMGFDFNVYGLQEPFPKKVIAPITDLKHPLPVQRNKNNLSKIEIGIYAALMVGAIAYSVYSTRNEG